MTDPVLGRLFEHNNWANQMILDLCAGLTDAQLDAQPRSVTKGSIRKTLSHLVDAQQWYLQLLTGFEPPSRWDDDDPPPLEKLRASLTLSGARFLELARDEVGKMPTTRRRLDDGWEVEPWVLVVQVLNHGTEHREQICSMLTDLGVKLPELDGWAYAEVIKAMAPAPT